MDKRGMIDKYVVEFTWNNYLTLDKNDWLIPDNVKRIRRDDDIDI